MTARSDEHAAAERRQQEQQETELRNALAIHAVEHRPQPHELRRGTGETPTTWHGAPS